jgi:acetate kinase
MTLPPTAVVVTVNGGSSSIKVSLATGDATATDRQIRFFSASVDRIGSPSAVLTTHAASTSSADTRSLPHAMLKDAIIAILGTVKDHIGTASIRGIGHRIVHGGASLHEHQLITPVVLAALKTSQHFDLAHLPREIALIESFAEAFPNTPQVACFDTAFHRDMPRVAQLPPIPRRYFRAGLRRFGFHGLSYTSLMQQLSAIAGPTVAHGRVILAHLGAGASMAAVHGGKPIDTTMSFTPLSGLVMATRPGDLDPGLLCHLLGTLGEAGTPKQLAAKLNAMLSTECGLLGVSELSGDMRDLLAARETNPQAADAINLFCRQARKHLCALAGTMGGVEAIVFSGGIGEHSPEVRAAICDGLQFLGVRLDTIRNFEGHGVISSADAPVAVYVLPTDEEAVIVKIVRSLVGALATAEPVADSRPNAEPNSEPANRRTPSPPTLAVEHTITPARSPDAAFHLHP